MFLAAQSSRDCRSTKRNISLQFASVILSCVHYNLTQMRKQTVVKRRKPGHFQAACVTRSDFLVSNRISSSAAHPKAGLCLSWVRMASVCAID